MAEIHIAHETNSVQSRVGTYGAVAPGIHWISNRSRASDWKNVYWKKQIWWDGWSMQSMSSLGVSYRHILASARHCMKHFHSSMSRVVKNWVPFLSVHTIVDTSYGSLLPLLNSGHLVKKKPISHQPQGHSMLVSVFQSYNHLRWRPQLWKQTEMVAKLVYPGNTGGYMIHKVNVSPKEYDEDIIKTLVTWTNDLMTR